MSAELFVSSGPFDDDKQNILRQQLVVEFTQNLLPYTTPEPFTVRQQNVTAVLTKRRPMKVAAVGQTISAMEM